MIGNKDNFTKIIIDNEIDLTLIEIISVFDDNTHSNPDLIDYIEQCQDILDVSIKALYLMSYYSPEIADHLLDINIVEILCLNIFNDYSENTRISALYLLGLLLKFDRTLNKLAQYPKFFYFLSNYFIKIDHFSIEKCVATVNLASRVSKRLKTKIVDCFKPSLLDIFINALGIKDCLVDASCGLFNLMRYDSEVVFFPSTEKIIETTINCGNPYVIYFSLQILKICNDKLPDERLISIYSKINFQCFNYFLTMNLPILYVTSNFFLTLFQKGAQFIKFSINNLKNLSQAYNDATFEIKFSILNAFVYAFINADSDLLSFFLSNGLEMMLIERIKLHDDVGKCLNALIIVSRYDKSILKSHQEIIEELLQIQADMPKEKTAKKIQILLKYFDES